MSNYYKGEKGALRYIVDITYGYDGEKTIEGLMGLLDEVREVALRELEQKEEQYEVE